MSSLQCVIKNYDEDGLGLGNILKCLISSLRINDDTVIMCHPEYIYGTYDTVLDSRFIYTDTATKWCEKVSTCRLLLFKHEEQIQQNIPSDERYFGGLGNPLFHSLFSFSHQIDWNYDPSKIHPAVQYSFFNALDKIIFLPIIHDEVAAFLSSVQQPFLGVSVRTWKASHESNLNRPYESDTYMKMICDVSAEHQLNQIVLSIDNEEFLEPYVTLPNVIVIRKPVHFNALQYAAFKMLVLSHSAHFIGTRTSTFTELVFWFSHHKTCVHTVF
jgi:hypothetical protein